MSYQFISNLNKHEHDEFINKHPLATLFQRSSWGSVKKEWHKEYVGLKNNDELIASAQCFTRKITFGLTMVYIPRGPIMDYSNQKVVEIFFNHLKAHFNRFGVFMIKLDPPIVLQQEAFDAYQYDYKTTHPAIEALKSVNANHCGLELDMYQYAQPRYLARLSKEVFDQKGFTTKTNRDIRQGNKKNVMLETIDSTEIKRFAKIITFTEKRKNIGLRNMEYFARIAKEFPNDCRIVMATLNQKELLAQTNARIDELNNKLTTLSLDSGPYKTSSEQLESALKEKQRLEVNIQIDGENVDLAGILTVKSNENVDILYMGLNERYNKYFAPHLLHQDAILWGFEHGAKTIDFGGIQGTLDDGLSRFKRSFNAEVVEMIGEFDIVLSSFIYKLYETGWPKLKKMMLFIKRKQK